MPVDRRRALEIDGLEQPVLDARAIVLGVPCLDSALPDTVPQPVGPSVVWEGAVQGDGTGPQKSYFVRLYSDGTGHCQCPAYYFRGTLRHDRAFECKHVQRARLRVGQQP